MLERLQIRNFRGFNALKIDSLSSINLIAGKNNSGKTSLLEAIALLVGAGDARLARNVNIIRGLESERSVSPAMIGSLWKQLFSDLNLERAIEIEGEHTSHGQLALKITSERQATSETALDLMEETSVLDHFSEHSLAFQYIESSEKCIKSQIRVKGQEFEISQPTTNPSLGAIVLLSRTRNIHRDAVRLGQLRKKKQGDLLLKALKIIEPKLQSIEDNSSSGTPMIWGDIGLSELVPLPAMGEGMTQIARLVLAIASMPNGVVLIDEVENGIHHSVLPDVWQAIDEAAKQSHTQIFATTHSFECIEAAHQALGAGGFLLHRLEASDAENRCVTYEPDTIDAAIRHNLEVR